MSHLSAHGRRGLLIVVGLACVLGLAACREAAAPPSTVPAIDDTRLVVAGDRHQVGFGRRVVLKARLHAKERSVDEGRWTIAWRQLFGAPVPGLPARGASFTLTTTAPPSKAVAQAHAGGVVPLSAAAAGRVVLEVEARAKDGRRRRQTVVVVPAFASAAWPRVAVGVDIYLAGADWQPSAALSALPAYAQHLTRLRWTARGAAWSTLSHPQSLSQPTHPSPGHPPLGGPQKSLTLRGGPFLGSQECGRFDCHPREGSGWAKTAHASVFERAIDGQLGGPASPKGPYRRFCASCHTLGDMPGADNDGFDDRQRKLGWRFPKRLTVGNFRNLPAKLRERANVQCEHCHGPGWFYTSYGVDVCAQCHDRPPWYRTVEQLSRTRMLHAERSLPPSAAQDDKRVCRQCHQTEAFLRSLRGHSSTSKVVRDRDMKTVGVTCVACHDPHGTACAKQLRLCGNVEVPGLTFDAGQGALCIACHSGEAGVSGAPGTLLRPFLPGTRAGGGGHARPTAKGLDDPTASPHAPHFQLLSGRGARFLQLRLGTVRKKANYPHRDVPDSCVGCHYDRQRRSSVAGGHSFSLLSLATQQLRSKAARPTPCDTKAQRARLAQLRSSTRTSSCAQCHGALKSLDTAARGDYDGDGRVAGLATEVTGLLTLLETELRRQVAVFAQLDKRAAAAAFFAVVDERIVVADARCQALKDDKGQPLTFHPRAPLLQKAAYNYLLVLRDGSAGLHNPQYTVRVLQDAITGLEKQRGARVMHRWKAL